MRTRFSVALAALLAVASVPLASSPAWAADPAAGCSTSAGVTTCVFAYTGAAQTWTVPSGVTSANFDVQAAQGGKYVAFGGLGGRASATLAVTPGETLQVNVGGKGADSSTGGAGGFNGGGSGAAGGGGASDVRRGGYVYADRLLVAGGGGGGGESQTVPNTATGGAGGGLSGGSGGTAIGGGGGTQTAGGAGGIASQGGGGDVSGQDGQVGIGGSAPTAGIGENGAGAGGGGYYGGGGGGRLAGISQTGPGGGGGGGSGFGPAGTTFQTGVRAGDGLVTITYGSHFNVTSAMSTGRNAFSVTFDAAPDASQATTLANYGVPGLTLSGTPILSGNTVTIDTSQQIVSVYEVTVSDVTRASDAASLTTNVADFTGTGPSPVAGASPASLSFGTIRVGVPSTSQQVTVTAAADGGPLHIGSLTKTGTNANDFGIGSDQCSGATLVPGASCTVLVTFIPGARGARTATLQVPDDAADSPQTVGLSGTGVAPVAQLSPTSIDFGTVVVGTTSGHRTLTITNVGDAGQDLLLTSETITGTNASEFAFAGDTCITNYIPAGESCTIDLTFTPGATGNRSATLTIADNGLGSPHTVSLAGAGGVPSADLSVGISASPNPVRTGQRVTYTITVFNAGSSTATGIVVNDSLSSQSTFVSATFSQGTCVTPVRGASGVISCSLASLAGGSSSPIQIVVTVIAKKSAITNTVTVSAATADPNLANNTASITTRVK